MSLEKILRLGSQETAGQAATGGDLRELTRAVQLSLAEAASSGDPAHAAEMVYAALTAADGLSSLLFGDSMADWVEATAAPADSVMALSGQPSSGVEHADPGYLADGKKRFPVDTEEHTRTSSTYIAMTAHAKAYTADQLARVKAKIDAAKTRHGITVAATSGDAPVLAQLRDGEALVLLAAMPASAQGVPMSHGPFSGTHSHAHQVTMTHDHEHTHVGDGMHGGTVHGANAGAKAWGNKGASGASGWGRD